MSEEMLSYIFTWHALNDAATCPKCRQLDGREWRDDWTETLAKWTGEYGAGLSLDTGDKAEGQASIKMTETQMNGGDSAARRDFITTVDWSEKNGVARTLNFKFKLNVTPTDAYTDGGYSRYFLFAPDASNTFYKQEICTLGSWLTRSYGKGDFSTFGGSPDWETITAARFLISVGKPDTSIVTALRLDDIYFSDGRANATVEDSGSQTSYGLREAQYIHGDLATSGECTTRGQTLLYQLKEPPTQITVLTLGNTNIWVGDRLSMSIPAEGISADYDVLSVEQSIGPRGFFANVVMVDSENVREPVISDSMSLMVRMQRELDDLGRMILRV